MKLTREEMALIHLSIGCLLKLDGERSKLSIKAIESMQSLYEKMLVEIKKQSDY